MRVKEKLRARQILTDWLQTLTPEDRQSLAVLVSELGESWLKDVIESASFAGFDAAEQRKKDRQLKEKAERDKKERQDSEDRQRRAREFRAGKVGYIPNAPSDLQIYPKLAGPPQCAHPERTNCNYDLVNERCEFMKYENGWKCTA